MKFNLIKSFPLFTPFSQDEIMQIIPYFQPIVELSGKITGFETLARIRTDEGAIQTPAHFMHRINQGNASFFDMHMLDQACAFIARCGDVYQLPVINVNFSPSTLGEKGITNKIANCLNRHGVSAANVCIEITEQAFGAYQQEILSNVKKISDAGHSIALDDYGSGDTNAERLRMLQRLLEKGVPLTVKLDMSVVLLQEWTKSFSGVLETSLFENVPLVFEGITLEGIDILNRAIGSKSGVKVQTFSLYLPMPEEAALDMVVRQNAEVTVKPIRRTEVSLALA